MTKKYRKYRQVDPEKRITKKGIETWVLRERLHRMDGGPAQIFPDGRKEWWCHGRRHNTKGPAIIRPNGVVSWCIGGEYYSLEEWCSEMHLSKEEELIMKMKYGIEYAKDPRT